MLAFPDDAGRINRCETSKTSAAGKQMRRYGKAICVVGENARCSPGKQQASLGKAKMGKAKKCGLRFLPFSTYGPGMKFPSEPPS